VLEATWTFRKEGARLTLQRSSTDGGEAEAVLMVARDDVVRKIAFANGEARDRFQRDMETFLLRTGWKLAGFSPNRRTPHDRRAFPRETNDRRRWWTDGAPVPRP
jgi:hypothetical protein